MTRDPSWAAVVKEFGGAGDIWRIASAELKEFLSSPLLGDEIIDKMEKMRRGGG